ncbi:hypothetical protein WMY93_031155, partial [Mugilogobius chulae]
MDNYAGCTGSNKTVTGHATGAEGGAARWRKSETAHKEVKDTRWLSQHLAIKLYNFCATYRFVAAVYMQADVLPHLARSFLAKLPEDLVDPKGLGAFVIVEEEERERRGHRNPNKDQLWSRFRQQVMDSYIDALHSNLERRFQHLGVLEAFSVLGPQAKKK